MRSKCSQLNLKERGWPKCKWEDSVRKDLKEKVANPRNWVDLAQDRDYRRALVNAT